MNDFVVWLIIALFYAPLHYLGPLLVILLTADERQRRARVMAALIDCSISMFLAFVLVIWLARENMLLAMLTLFASLAMAYLFGSKQTALGTG